MRLLPRLCFVLLATLALASVLGGTGCTRRGIPTVVASSSPGQRTVYVSAATGNDSTGIGTQSLPYKTVTKALRIAASPGPIAIETINIGVGDYNAALGEKFPLVIPVGVSITGNFYGRGPSKGTFIDGSGEDTTFEKLVGAPAGSYYAAVVIAGTVSGVSLTNLYIGASSPALPSASTVYDSVDNMGGLSATTTSFTAPTKVGLKRFNGVLVPGGVFSCSSCVVGGNTYAIAAFSVPQVVTSPSPSSSASTNPYGQATPSVTLFGQPSQGAGQIGGRVVGIVTDGSVPLTVSNQGFSGGGSAFADNFPPLLTGLTPVPADFGLGAGNPPSTGGNVMIGVPGAKTTEIYLTLPDDVVTAYGDTWTPKEQNASPHGQYLADQVFKPGAGGYNVTIANDATGAKVFVGPFKQPTPTPSASPSGSPSPSPSPASKRHKPPLTRP